MQIHKMKLTERKFRDHPWQTFGKLREAGEMIRIKIPFLGKGWAATTYDAVNEVLKTPEDFVRDPKNAGRKYFIPLQWMMPRSFFAVANNMLGADGEKHRRLRLLVDRAFAMRSIESMSERIEDIAMQHLQQLRSQIDRHGKADLIEHYAKPFPLTVICELLGLPLEDRDKFARWFAPFSTLTSIFGFFRLGSGVKNIARYLKDQFQEVKNRPRPGLITDLVNAELEGDQFDEEELLSMVFLLLVAGHETTVHLISNMVYTLLQQPTAKDALLSDWSLGSNAIDEVLRYCSPLQLAKPRYAARDMSYRGVQIKRGEMVTPFLACANYDPSRFRDPMKFDIHRQRNYHMTFGSGPHVCLGMKLAKSETIHAVRILFEAFPNLKPEFDLQRPDWNKRMGVRGFATLMVGPGS